jgi:putative salt-induced outer membrane protein YdiY
MKLSYTVRHTSEVPDDVDKTDTETAVTLVYGF